MTEAYVCEQFAQGRYLTVPRFGANRKDKKKEEINEKEWGGRNGEVALTAEDAPTANGAIS